MTIELTLKQEVPEDLAALIQEAGGKVTGLVENCRDEFVDVSFDSIQGGRDFQELLHKNEYTARFFSHFGPKQSTVRVFA